MMADVGAPSLHQSKTKREDRRVVWTSSCSELSIRCCRKGGCTGSARRLPPTFTSSRHQSLCPIPSVSSAREHRCSSLWSVVDKWRIQETKRAEKEKHSHLIVLPLTFCWKTKTNKKKKERSDRSFIPNSVTERTFLSTQREKCLEPEGTISPCGSAGRGFFFCFVFFFAVRWQQLTSEHTFHRLIFLRSFLNE